MVSPIAQDENSTSSGPRAAAVGLAEGPSGVTPSARGRVNIGELERTASVLIGSLLLASGIRRITLSTVVLGYVGYRFIQRGATGKCALYKALGVSTAHPSAASTQPAVQP